MIVKTLQFTFALLLIFTLTNCNSSNKDEIQRQEVELKEKKPVIDSTKTTNQEKSTVSIQKSDDQNDTSESRLAGQHKLTLQWISWEQPGIITFTPIGNKKYEIDGIQKGNTSNEECSACYVTVQGIIEEITPKKLRFTGKIESSIHHIQAGKPCLKEGTFDFVSTKNRKYWRCKNMKGCKGVTDYVDIYF